LRLNSLFSPFVFPFDLPATTAVSLFIIPEKAGLKFENQIKK